MTNHAFVGGIYLERGDGLSPESFARICQVYNYSGFGQSNEQTEVTTFCSAGSKEYVGGLADGSEFSLDLNFETYQWASGPIEEMIADVEARAVRNFQLVADDGTNPAVTFHFAASCMSWELAPSIDSKNSVKFGLKISGAITRTVA